MEYTEYQKAYRRKAGLKYYLKNSKKINENARKKYSKMTAVEKEQYSRKKKDWRSKNKDKRRETFLQYKYGIRQSDYNRMLELQNYVCSRCRS